MDIFNEKLKRGEHEEYDHYAMRLFRNIDVYEIDKYMIADILNGELGTTRDESAFRKKFIDMNRGFDYGYEQALKELKEEDSMGLSTLAPKSHLDKLKDLTGEYTVRKREMSLERNELAKLMRTAVGGILLTEQYVKCLEDGIIELPKFTYSDIPSYSNGVLKVLVSDWHIGMELYEDYNDYNFEIANKRIEKYAQKIIEKARLYNITDINITNLGDIVEAIHMRGNQSYDCEFTESEQLVYAQELMLKLIMSFINEGFTVSMSAVRGNHDRLQGSKNDNIDADSAMFVVMENLKKLFEFSDRVSGNKTPITFYTEDKYYASHSEEIYGHKIKYVHGDNDSKGDMHKLSKYSKTDDVNYDILVLGHLHHFSSSQKNRNEREVYCGCLMGSNEYGKNRIKSVADASQSYIVFLDNGDIIIDDINLQDV